MGTDETRGHTAEAGTAAAEAAVALYLFIYLSPPRSGFSAPPAPAPRSRAPCGAGAARCRPRGAAVLGTRPSAPHPELGGGRPGPARPRSAPPGGTCEQGNASQRRVLPPGGGGGGGHGAVAAAAASFLGPAAVEAAGPGQRGPGRLPTAPHGRQLLAELALVGAAGRGRLLHSLPGPGPGGWLMGRVGARGIRGVWCFCP